MGQIRFKMPCTDLVQYYIRTTVRYSWNDGFIPKEWHIFCKNWLDMLSDSDRELIYFVFDKQFCDVFEGLSCYQNGEIYQTKKERLFNLEKNFAIAGGLVVEETNNDRRTES